MQRITVRGEEISVDLLLWRLYGVRGRSLVERTLEINPGLAALGPILPLGTVFTVPELPSRSGPVERRVVTLFG